MGAESGFPRKSADKYYVASLAREYTDQAVEVLAAIMQGDGAALARISGKNELPSYIRVADQIRAAEILLERGWGKAPSEVRIDTDPNHKGIVFKVEIVHTQLVNGQVVPMESLARTGLEPVTLPSPP